MGCLFFCAVIPTGVAATEFMQQGDGDITPPPSQTLRQRALDASAIEEYDSHVAMTQARESSQLGEPFRVDDQVRLLWGPIVIDDNGRGTLYWHLRIAGQDIYAARLPLCSPMRRNVDIMIAGCAIDLIYRIYRVETIKVPQIVPLDPRALSIDAVRHLSDPPKP